MELHDDDATILPGRALHYVFRNLLQAVPLEISVVDGDDVLAVSACEDKEGWTVIIVENVGTVPVEITPETPLRLVIMPRQRVAGGSPGHAAKTINAAAPRKRKKSGGCTELG